MYCCYILYSEKFQKIYIGQTANLIARIKSHNSLSKKGYTIRFRPWKVVWVEFLDTRQDALKREKELKSGQGRQWIYDFVLKSY